MTVREGAPTARRVPVTQDDRALEHFVRLAFKGRQATASGGERRAHRLAVAIIDNLPGLDELATDGLVEFLKGVKASPELAAEVVGHPR